MYYIKTTGAVNCHISKTVSTLVPHNITPPKSFHCPLFVTIFANIFHSFRAAYSVTNCPLLVSISQNILTFYHAPYLVINFSVVITILHNIFTSYYAAHSDIDLLLSQLQFPINKLV